MGRTHADRALALLAGTQFLLILDTAIINVAAPSIGTQLGLTAATLSWIANAYLVAFGGLLMLSGRAADLLERRGLFVGGLGVLVIGSAVGSVAGSAGLLIAARAVQGLGAAVAAAAAFALLLSLFPEGTGRQRALGVFAAMAGAGGAAGTVLGGVLTSWLGWRSTFVLNVVAGLVLALLALRVLAVDRPGHEGRARFDVAGALSVTAGLALLAYALVNTGVAGWTAPSTVAAALVAFGLLTVFALLQTRVRAPLVPPAVVRGRPLRSANLLSGLAQFVLFPMFFLVSLYLQTVLHYPPVLGGLGLLPLSVVVVLVAANVERLIRRIGLRAVMVLGFILVAVGMLGLSTLRPDGSFAGDVLVPSLVLGVGLPMVTITTNVAATSVRPGEIGLASGLVNTSQQFGAVLGLAVFSAISTRVAFLAAAGVALLAAFGAMRRDA